MTVHVHLEGVSDRDAMVQLLAPLIEAKRRLGVSIRFHPAGKGDAKKFLLLQLPARAANTSLNTPADVVVVVPDLYPQNHGFDHRTADELRAGVQRLFRSALPKDRRDDVRLLHRFRVFCFKHDLEALVLAAERQLAARIGTADLKRDWTIPVEDQNHNRPPKHVVRDLFRRHDQSYQEAADAPLILANANLAELVKDCPQCFAPFVKFLEGLTLTGE